MAARGIGSVSTRVQGSGYGGRQDEADDGRGQEGAGDADDWDSESCAGWADSDGSAGMPRGLDSEDLAGFVGSRLGEGGTEDYADLPWPAGDVGCGPAQESYVGDADGAEWAGFPGPLSPTRTGVAKVAREGACDPMGLDGT